MKFFALPALVAAVAAAPAPEVTAAPAVDPAQLMVMVRTIGFFPASGGPISYTVQTVTAPASELLPTSTSRPPKPPAASYVTLVDESNHTFYVVAVPEVTGQASARRLKKPLGALPPLVLDVEDA